MQRRKSLDAVALEIARGVIETFNHLYQRLVAVGESSGTLEQSFHHLAKLLQQKKIFNAVCVGILAILGVACTVSALLLLQVVPTFEQMFAQFGMPAWLIIDLSHTGAWNNVAFTAAQRCANIN